MLARSYENNCTCKADLANIICEFYPFLPFNARTSATLDVIYTCDGAKPVQHTLAKGSNRTVTCVVLFVV
eukprot:6185519-Pleurochrysis_carterae.AAC.6